MTTISQARSRPGAQPVYLVEITLQNGGPTLYLSDRNIEVGGQFYLNRLDDLTGIGEELERATSEGLNANITLNFANIEYPGYNHLIEIGETYPFEGAAVTIKEMYLTEGAPSSDTETIFKGILDEPGGIDESSFTCKVSDKSIALDENWSQAKITTELFPNAHEDVGKVIPFVYGNGILMPAHRVDWGITTTLKAKINESVTSLELSDVSRIPSSNFDIWIDNEKIHVGSRSGFVCNSLTRAYGGTAPSSHRAGAEVWVDKAAYDSVLAAHAGTVGDIYAEIQGRLLRVTSGVSAPVVNGRQYIRASSIIKVDAVDDAIGVTDGIVVTDGISVSDTIGVNTGNHAHAGGGTTQVQGNNGSHWPTVGITWAGVDVSMYDWNKEGGNRLSGDPSSTWPAGSYFRVNFPAWTGGAIGKIYINVTYGQHSGTTGQATVDGLNLADATGPYTIRKLKSNTIYPSYIDIIPSSTCNKNIDIYEIWLEVEAATAASAATGVAKTGAAAKVGEVTKTGSATKSGTTVGTRTVDRFHAVFSGYTDPDGNYGGIGTRIERPDWLIKHFLVVKRGFTLGEIDDPSFAAAGALYAAAVTGGYKFGFVVDGEIRPSEFTKKLARECRSTVEYRAGKWYLDYIPDAAPAVDKTISSAVLAGMAAKFVFDKTARKDIKNDLTASFARNYSRLNMDSEWDGTAAMSDGASITKYGSRPTRPGEIQFDLIRSQAMADHVLEHMLLELRQPLKIVRFPVFFDLFSLAVGNTIQITNPLYNNTKYFIESMKRIDKMRADAVGREWWPSGTGTPDSFDELADIDTLTDVDTLST